jgi:hypothetical protein
LRIEVEQNGLISASRESLRQVHGHRGFTAAALLAFNRDDPVPVENLAQRELALYARR